jgi:hypothetical protein
MQPSDLLSLGALGAVDLVFTAGNDADTLPTSFWIDAVRLCMTTSKRLYLPLLVDTINPPGASAR